MWNLLAKWFGPSVIGKQAASLIRGLMKAASGWLVANGMIEAGNTLAGIEPQIVDILVALILFLVAQLWSFQAKTR